MSPTRPALPAITIAQLEYLVAVDRHRTWAEAAHALGVTPSALSQGLAELERRLGLELFEREGRRRRPAPNAAEVLRYARSVVAQTADLAAWAERTRTGRAGRVRIGMVDVAAVGHFATELRRFRQARPDVELLLHVGPSGALLAELVAGALDAAVVVAPPVRSGDVDLEPLLDEPLRVYGPAGSAGARPADWGPWVLFPRESHTRQLVATALGRAGATVEMVAESNQPDVLRAMVRLGLGWTVLPVVQAESGAQPLVPVRDTPIATRQLVIARRHASVTDPAVDALLDGLRHRAAHR